MKHTRNWLVHIAGVIAVVLAFVLTTLAASTAARAADAEVYVGQVANTNAFVAVVTDGMTVTAYVCDGTADGVSLWGWFDGELSEGRGDLVSTNGLVLRIGVVNHEEGYVTGTLIMRDGTTTEFSAQQAAGDQAGLWRYQGVVNDAAVLAGWIGLPDGQQRGAMMRGGTSATVGTIDDGTTRLDGVDVTPLGFHIHVNP